MIGAMTEYTYRADWSHETREYLGQCLEFPYFVVAGVDAGGRDRRSREESGR